MLYPLLWMVASSFKPDELIFTDLSSAQRRSTSATTRGLGRRCRSAFSFFRNSLLICRAAVVGNVLSCSLAAYAFARLSSVSRAVCSR